MTVKEELRNEVLLAMKPHVSSEVLFILDAVLKKALYNVELEKMQTLPSTGMDDNKYVIELFKLRKAPKLSKETVDQYMMSINELILYTGKSLLRIEDYDVDMYLHYKKENGNQECSVNNIRRKISAFYTWMRKCKLVTENPCDTVDIYKEVEKPIEYLQGYSVEYIREKCKIPRDRALIEFLRSTGARIGEIPLVNRNDINWHDGTILLYAPKRKQYRVVVLDEVARVHVKNYIESRSDTNEALFVSLMRPNFRMAKGGLREAYKKISERAAVESTPHSMRRTFATNLNKRNCPLSVIQKLMGHAQGTMTTTKCYINMSDAQLIQAHAMYAE